MILTIDQADIQAGNFRDVEEFFAELDPRPDNAQPGQTSI